MTTEPSIKIDNARFVLTLDPERRIITDGAVLVRGKRIDRVGKAAGLRDITADRVIDAREMVVTPGFVNGHMHVSYAHATRGIYPDDLGNRYLPYVFTLQSVMTPEEEYHTSLLGITELLKGGTTCFVDPGSTKHVDACLKAYEQAGCRIITGAHVTDRPNPLNLPVYSTEEALARTESAITAYDGALDGRVRAWAMPFSAPFCSPELLRGAKALADRHGTRLTLHHSFSAQQVAVWVEQHGERPAQTLERWGVLGPNVLLAHALGLDQAEVEVVARTGTAVAAVPTAVKGRGRHDRHGAAARDAGGRRARPRSVPTPATAQPRRDAAGDVPDRRVIQGRPPRRNGHAGRDGAGAGDDHRQPAPWGGWTMSWARSSPANAPTWCCSTRASRNGAPSGTSEQPRLQR
ncbi:MAG: amidohydrolase family protein [Dehalococcoidia bacterium]